MTARPACFIALMGLLAVPVVAHAALAQPWDWLLTPLSGAGAHHIASRTAWHARLMVLGWGVLLPLGALGARFFKILPGQDWPRQLDNKTWWRAHRALQYAGVWAMTVGLGLAWGLGSGHGSAARVHAWLGWSLCAAGWLQIASGLLRGSKGGPTDVRLRGDHYDMTRRRIGFERLHKSLGWLAIVLAVVNIVLGLAVADAPRWMAVVLAGWWSGFGIAFIGLQRQGRCIDTYQAIWGPGRSHPGHRQAPIGWGVRRY
ncbi:cytochrome b561 domain-containing protein [Variovorax sp. PBL-E5]|uniref:cytochrome b561 domain-containing protein n=1 Tax=Variovorax sp. PBL-E5 TaxID=434014 RepID=UPI0013168334|nr:cytochrome b561 domain-containing protein [Variovorax sp. PBL-E5]VTU45299.1 hypothetical protein E5P2_00105 [Variovorax sp. PBL-E5]